MLQDPAEIPRYYGETQGLAKRIPLPFLEATPQRVAATVASARYPRACRPEWQKEETLRVQALTPQHQQPTPTGAFAPRALERSLGRSLGRSLERSRTENFLAAAGRRSQSKLKQRHRYTSGGHLVRTAYVASAATRVWTSHIHTCLGWNRCSHADVRTMYPRRYDMYVNAFGKHACREKRKSNDIAGTRECDSVCVCVRERQR